MAKKQKDDARPAEESPAPSVDVRPDIDRILEIAGVGGRIAIARQKRGLTQRELSEAVGKARATVIQYEQGRLQPPLKEIEKIAKVLDVAPETIAFGRQGITGLSDDTSHAVSLAEKTIRGEEEAVGGGFAIPDSLADHLGIDREGASVFVLTEPAPAFGYAVGDRIFVNPEPELAKEHGIYAFRTWRGVEVARLLPSLGDWSEVVKLNGSNGETHSCERSALRLLGLVVGSIRSS